MHLQMTALIALLAAGTAAAQTRERASVTRERGARAAVARTLGAAPETRRVAAGPAQGIAGIAPPPLVLIPSIAAFYAPAGSYVSSIPVVVLPDGRVFADFGRGFEQMVRGCGSSGHYLSSLVPGPVQPVVVQPVVVQPPVVVTQPLPYNPPLVGQYVLTQPLTPQMGAQILAGQSVIVNSFACWGRNQQGQVFIYSQ